MVAAAAMGVVWKLSALQTFLLMSTAVFGVFIAAAAMQQRGIGVWLAPPVLLEKWRAFVAGGEEDKVCEVVKVAGISLRRGGEPAFAEWLSGGFVPLIVRSFEKFAENDELLGAALSCFASISKVDLGKSVILGDADLEADDVKEALEAEERKTQEDLAKAAGADGDDGAGDGEDDADIDEIDLSVEGVALADAKPVTPLQLLVTGVRASLQRDRDRNAKGEEEGQEDGDDAGAAAALVQKRACVFFGALCDEDSDVAGEMVDEGCMDAILDAMEWFELHAEIQQWACLALFSMVFAHPGNKLYLFRRGGLKHVVAAIAKHTESMEVQRQAIATMYAMLQISHKPGHAMDVNGIRASAFELGLLPAIEASVERWPQNKEIVTMGTHILEAATVFGYKPAARAAPAVIPADDGAEESVELLKDYGFDGDTAKEIDAPKAKPAAWRLHGAGPGEKDVYPEIVVADSDEEKNDEKDLD